MTQIRKYSSLILLSTTLFTLSCSGQKYVRLNDSFVKIPNKSSMYKNIDKFDTKLLAIIDTEVIYEEFDVYNNILQRLDTADVDKSYYVIRFFPNGYFHSFHLREDNIHNNSSSNKNSYNPERVGIRGVYYYENNKIRYDIYGRTSEMGGVRKISGEFIINGDTLIDNRDNLSYQNIYIKREVPKEYLDYQVDWKGDLEKQGK